MRHSRHDVPQQERMRHSRHKGCRAEHRNPPDVQPGVMSQDSNDLYPMSVCINMG